MVSLRIMVIAGFAAGFVATGVAGCSADAEGSGGYFGGSDNGGSAGSGGRDTNDGGIDANVGQGGGPTSPGDYSALCGGGCVPGTAQAVGCEQAADGAGGGAQGGAGGGNLGDGGAPSLVGDCRLGLGADESVNGTCVPADGMAAVGASCFTASDCGPGLGCVALGCRPYCCGDLEACPPSTYCAPTPIAKGELPTNDTQAPDIPVCMPAKTCTLLDPTSCGPQQTCTVVRADGTTSCVDPGPHTAGEPCPCAAGFMCATGKGECLQLCAMDLPDSCPNGSICQGDPASFPPGFGVCAQL